jgi:adapter protein MecA 1/2
MRLERLNYNKIKIFLTLDDLTERGLTKEDIWKDSLKWHQLFHEMLEEASDEFGVDIQGSVAVEIFSMQAQGMVMIVTMQEQEDEEEEDFLLSEGFIDMQVVIDDNEDLLFVFNDVEDVIQLSGRLAGMGLNGGSLYHMEGRYYLLFDDILAEDAEKLASMLAEYGSTSLVTRWRLLEYGKEVIADSAIETLSRYF